MENKITNKEINEYKDNLILELEKLGATNKEKELVKENTIINAIRQNREPKDVAWAILQ